ncbi:MAG: IPT/TIG domain-containing protein [Anaeromyxobacter sp.]
MTQRRPGSPLHRLPRPPAAPSPAKPWPTSTTEPETSFPSPPRPLLPSRSRTSSPRAGGIGQVVTVHGTGFSPSPALDTVTLGGSHITPIAATSSSLTIVVPEGAASGPISVSSQGQVATSVAAFSVITDVQVTDFWPKIGRSGDSITITGFNFDGTPSGNTVRVGTGVVTVRTASQNTLNAQLTTDAATGQIVVTNARGTGVSAGTFFKLPSGYEAADVEFTGVLSGTQPVTATTTTAQRVAFLAFDGTAGEFVTLFVGNVTYPGSTSLKVFAPAGDVIYSGTITPSASTKHTLPALPTTGGYMVVLEPGANATGSAAVQRLSNAVAALTQGQAPATLSFAPGQNGHFTFSGAAGDLLGLGCSALSLAPAGSTLGVRLYGPTGTNLWSSTFSGPTSAQLPALAAAGSYRLALTPSGVASGTVTCLLSTPDVGMLIVDGDSTPFSNATVGQQGRFMFAGSAGDLLGLALTSYAASPAGSTSLKVLAPGGATVWSATANAVNSWQLPALPSSGTYTLVAQPSAAVMVSTEILVSKALAGGLASGVVTRFETRAAWTERPVHVHRLGGTAFHAPRHHGLGLHHLRRDRHRLPAQRRHHRQHHVLDLHGPEAGPGRAASDRHLHGLGGAQRDQDRRNRPDAH